MVVLGRIRKDASAQVVNDPYNISLKAIEKSRWCWY